MRSVAQEATGLSAQTVNRYFDPDLVVSVAGHSHSETVGSSVITAYSALKKI